MCTSHMTGSNTCNDKHKLHAEKVQQRLLKGMVSSDVLTLAAKALKRQKQHFGANALASTCHSLVLYTLVPL